MTILLKKLAKTMNRILLAVCKLSENRNGKKMFLVGLLIAFILCFQTAQEGFQADSETLVVGKIRAENENILTGAYGLGRYEDILGPFDNYHVCAITIPGWEKGYSEQGNAILLKKGHYAQEMEKNAQFVQFPDNEIFKIGSTKTINEYLVINLPGAGELSSERNGTLDKIRFLDADKTLLPSADYSSYVSQYGLQGYFFLYMVKHFLPHGYWLGICHQICIFLSAVVFIAIGYFVGKKYNWLLAGCYWITFLTSPWIINFSPNLYWVEFTWFFPMLLGLLCSLYGDNKFYRWGCYLFAFVAIFLKSLCGYEYLSTIVLGLVMFPLIDCVIFIKTANRQKGQQSFFMVVMLGIMAIGGFLLALGIHGWYRGSGDWISGIQTIYQQDVLRRTWGGSVSNFGMQYADSFSAPGWRVVERYFSFHTSVVLGLPGIFFAFLAGTPIFVWFYGKKIKKVFLENDIVALYTVSFLATISWFVLAKAHSYIHTHINYVLWYFGFVQVCLYILILLMQKNLCKKGYIDNKIVNRLMKYDPFKESTKIN